MTRCVADGLERLRGAARFRELAPLEVEVALFLAPFRAGPLRAVVRFADAPDFRVDALLDAAFRPVAPRLRAADARLDAADRRADEAPRPPPRDADLALLFRLPDFRAAVLRPRELLPLFLRLFEPSRDDFLAAAMIQRRGRNVRFDAIAANL